MWKKMDAIENPPIHLEKEDLSNCYFARDYVSGGGFADEANNLISNFKKDISTKGTGQWFYKMKAVDQFAKELADWLEDDCYYIAAIPTSKQRSDPAYDPRMDLMLEKLVRLCPKIEVVELITRKRSVKAAHHSDVRPTIRETYESMQWNGPLVPRTDVILLDDVVIKGTTYRACKQLLSEHMPKANLSGIFWARTIRPANPICFGQ